MRDVPTDRADVVVGDAFGHHDAMPWHLDDERSGCTKCGASSSRRLYALNVIDFRRSNC